MFFVLCCVLHVVYLVGFNCWLCGCFCLLVVRCVCVMLSMFRRLLFLVCDRALLFLVVGCLLFVVGCC